jgi:hypothetical protein
LALKLIRFRLHQDFHFRLTSTRQAAASSLRQGFRRDKSARHARRRRISGWRLAEVKLDHFSLRTLLNGLPLLSMRLNAPVFVSRLTHSLIFGLKCLAALFFFALAKTFSWVFSHNYKQLKSI